MATHAKLFTGEYQDGFAAATLASVQYTQWPPGTAVPDWLVNDVALKLV